MSESCLSAHVRIVDKPIAARAKRTTSPLVALSRTNIRTINAKVSSEGGELRSHIRKINTAPVVDMVLKASKISARCGLVCSLAEVEYYLAVEPQYIWLTPLNNFSEDVIIYSNVDWIIT